MSEENKKQFKPLVFRRLHSETPGSNYGIRFFEVSSGMRVARWQKFGNRHDARVFFRSMKASFERTGVR